MMRQSIKQVSVAVFFFLPAVFTASEGHTADFCECLSAINVFGTDPDSIVVHGGIEIDMGSAIDIGSRKGRIGTVLHHALSGSSSLSGNLQIVYDSVNPAPPCTLLSECAGPGCELFPARHTVHLNWIMSLDSLPGMMLRTVTPVTLVSQVVTDWPLDTMIYTVVTDVYWEDMANPGDTVLFSPIAGLQTTVIHGQQPIPTLTEWGMIAFAVLLVGFMAWGIIRKRRAVSLRI